MSSDPTSAPTSSTASPENAATIAADPTVKASKSAEEVDLKASYSSFSEFQEKAPKKVVDSIMQSIAENIIRDMKKGAERVKKAFKKIREN